MTPSRPLWDSVSLLPRSRHFHQIIFITILPDRQQFCPTDKRYMYYFINHRSKYEFFVIFI